MPNQYTRPVPVPGRNMGRADARIEARAKVTGGTVYAADTALANPAYAYLLTSAIARGRIRGFDLADARAMPGVIEIFTYQNFPKPGSFRQATPPPTGRQAPEPNPLRSADIAHEGQMVGVVVAETYEIARAAANRVRIAYDEQAPAAGIGSRGTDIVDLADVEKGHEDPAAGDFARAYAAAAVTFAGEYGTPTQHHNAIELFTTLAEWRGDDLTLHEASQNVHAQKSAVAAALGVDPARVTVVNPFVGGSFGGKNPTPRPAIVAAIAKALRRPVKLVVTRDQGFTTNTYRAETRHAMRLGASADGRLVALSHEGTELTSRIKDYRTAGTELTTQIYGVPNIASKVRVARADRNTPGFMRSPPEVPYMFALESAIDELAEKCGMDPVAFRRLNETAVSPVSAKTYTSRSLNECYAAAAAQFGWDKRDPRPRSMRSGEWMVGYGCATSARPAQAGASNARVKLTPDGRALVQIGAHDVGTGATTIMGQVAAERLGLPLDRVSVEMGDTRLPRATGAGGSRTTAGGGSAVRAACDKVAARFGGTVPTGAALRPAMARLGMGAIEEYAEWSPPGEALGGAAPNSQPRAEPPLACAFGAQFVEIHVHSRTREIRVPRITGAFAAGRIMNPRTARSQLMGGMIWGIGSALHEATEMDEKRGRYVNDSIAEYLIPVNADIREVEVILIPEVDDKIPLGAKGVGELGNVGTNAAIANAVYHATGRRIRDLPITIDKLIS